MCSLAHPLHNAARPLATSDRALFEQLGGFDEALRRAYNDVDFCLRALRARYRNAFLRHVEGPDVESKSRGYANSAEQRARLEAASAIMRERWGGALYHDPGSGVSSATTLEIELVEVAAIA